MKMKMEMEMDGVDQVGEKEGQVSKHWERGITLTSYC